MLGPAAVGVHIDGTAPGLGANEPNGRLNDICGHQGIAFTALAETDHTLFDPADVSQGYLRNFIG